MKTLVFDIWADYGHFRKYYTTSSPLTFSFPPPPTVAGMLGAIIGSSKKDYLNDFPLDQLYLGIKVLTPIKKVRLGLNFINTKDGYWRPVGKKGHEPRTQIRAELLHQPCYRIYLHHKEEKRFKQLAEAIERHYSHFTLSMGLSELLANFRLVGIYESSITKVKEPKVSSVIPERYLENENLVIEANNRFFKEMVPIVMTPERIVERYENVILETEGNNVKLKFNNQDMLVLETGENICYF